MEENMEIGAQLYTIRAYTQTKEDFRRSMKKIADMGYSCVQLSAVGKDVTAQVAADICKEYGLKIVLTHSSIDRILYDTDQLIAEHKLMGCKYIGLGAMPDKYRCSEWIGYFKEDFKEPVKKMKSNRSSSSARFSSRPPSTTAMYSGSNVCPISSASARLVAGA